MGTGQPFVVTFWSSDCINVIVINHFIDIQYTDKNQRVFPLLYIFEYEDISMILVQVWFIFFFRITAKWRAEIVWFIQDLMFWFI